MPPDTNYMNWEIPRLPKPEIPLLPPITDNAIRTMVFTHTSAHAIPKAGLIEEEMPDNEKLEHQGDALLGKSTLQQRAQHGADEITGSIIVNLLQDEWPNLFPGPATVNSNTIPTTILAAADAV